MPTPPWQTPATMNDQEMKYLPAAWNDRKDAEADAWKQTVCESFTKILHTELEHVDGMTKVRELIADARMIDDPTAMSVCEIYIDRVRRSPKCFTESFRADLWSAEKVYGLQLMINYTGVSLFTQVRHPREPTRAREITDRTRSREVDCARLRAIARRICRPLRELTRHRRVGCRATGMWPQRGGGAVDEGRWAIGVGRRAR